jgi:hypothetical protein
MPAVRAVVIGATTSTPAKKTHVLNVHEPGGRAKSD